MKLYENEGKLELPKGKDFMDTSVEHFENLVKKDGYDVVVKRLVQLANWNVKKNPRITSKARSILKELKKDEGEIMKEERISTVKTEIVLEKFLTENGMEYYDIEMLTESKKTNATSEIVATVMETIHDKIEKLDLFSIFKSKGDIKLYSGLADLQDAIQQLENMAAEYSLKELAEYVSKITKAMITLNKLSGEYKEAFRNKRTILMMHYTGILQSIIAAVAYLISVSCDINNNGDVNPKTNIKIENLLYFTALDTFNNQTMNNTFKNAVREVAVLRECYSEISVDDLFMLTEASDTVSILINGAKDFFTKLRNQLDGNGAISRLIYKTAGIIMLVVSLRDSFYTTFRLNSKLSAITDFIGNFVRTRMNGSGSKVSNFAKFLSADIEVASDNAERDIVDEDRNIVKTIQKPIETPVQNVPIDDVIDSDFDF